MTVTSICCAIQKFMFWKEAKLEEIKICFSTKRVKKSRLIAKTKKLEEQGKLTVKRTRFQESAKMDPQDGMTRVDLVRF